MTTATTRAKTEGYVYVDLDTPPPWWASVVIAAAVILIATVLVAPWAIDWDDDAPTTQPANTALQDTGTLCRPDSTGLPALLDPSLASWSRFCEWFINPAADAP